jgi:hypothetical protein
LLLEANLPDLPFLRLLPSLGTPGLPGSGHLSLPSALGPPYLILFHSGITQQPHIIVNIKVKEWPCRGEAVIPKSRCCPSQTYWGKLGVEGLGWKHSPLFPRALVTMKS